MGAIVPPSGRCIAPLCAKIIYDLTIEIINKYFEFQNDCLKIFCIRYNYTQICTYQCVKENKN